MVRDMGGPGGPATNNVQDVEVQGVQRQASVSVHDESGGRRLSLRAVLLHDAYKTETFNKHSVK